MTNVRSFAQERRRRAPAAELADTARRLERERAEAGGRVEGLLRDTPREEWPALTRCSALHNCGALQRLSVEVSSRLDAAPFDALTLSAIAIAIADALPPDAYPPVVRAQIRAMAWSDRAQALSQAGRQAEALEASLRAESLLEGFGSAAHDRAIVRMVRARVLRRLGRTAPCLQLLEECRTVFFDHGDAGRYLECEAAIEDVRRSTILRMRWLRYALAGLLLAAALGGILWLTVGRRCDEQRHQREVALQQRLFAIRRALDDAYAGDRRRPRQLEELVPKYLPRVPADPLTGVPDWRLERDGDGIVDIATPVRGATCGGIPYEEL